MIRCGKMRVARSTIDFVDWTSRKGRTPSLIGASLWRGKVGEAEKNKKHPTYSTNTSTSPSTWKSLKPKICAYIRRTKPFFFFRSTVYFNPLCFSFITNAAADTADKIAKMPVENKAALSTFHVSLTFLLYNLWIPPIIPHAYAKGSYQSDFISLLKIAMGSPPTGNPTQIKKKPDYILALLYCLVYLEVSWLIVMLWRSCH
ncbi:hypothetical protein BGZ60DRAFT_84596 [Tricladium varicosporioides]|nr:hypothetical protein BGZ60DRAFT_84596 [Hymenoscyphus varicosporioides]